MKRPSDPVWISSGGILGNQANRRRKQTITLQQRLHHKSLLRDYHSRETVMGLRPLHHLVKLNQEGPYILHVDEAVLNSSVAISSTA